MISRHTGVANITEETLCFVWQHQLLNKERLFTESQEGLSVVYPGRRNRSAGPDFRDAIVSTRDGTLWRGDIEVDLTARDWQSHGHNTNPNYNQVIIHVVLEARADALTFLEMGRKVPILELSGLIDVPWESLDATRRADAIVEKPCWLEEIGFERSEPLAILKEAGMRRFHHKALVISQSLTVEEPDDVFFELVADALGFASNREPFRRLTRAMPFHVLNGLFQGKDSGRALLTAHAVLLGTAGLLPSQCIFQPNQGEFGDDYLFFLEKVWRNGGFSDSLTKADWRFSGLRPANSPTQRIAGLAALAVRFAKGIAGPFMEIVRLKSTADRWRQAQGAIMVAAGEFHQAGLRSEGRTTGGENKLIGRSRAAEISLNVVLPFACAFGDLTGDAVLSGAATEAFLNHPRLSENWITRYVSHQVFGAKRSPLALRAIHQQGMLGIYYDYCKPKSCVACPVTNTAAA